MQPLSQATENTVAPTSGTSQQSYRGAVQFAALALLIALLYYRIAFNLIAQWLHDPNYSHGFIAVIFCIWIVWQQRKRLAELPSQPSWWGLIFIFIGLSTLILGVLGAENFLSRTSLLMVLTGLVLYFRGWKYLRVVLFPLACLLLAIPIPAIIFNEIALPLQFQASKSASGLLSLIGVPVLREGNLIHLPSLSLDVAEACSGIRSLVSLITLAVVYSYFFEKKLSLRVLLVLSAIPIAVLANGLRITGTGILGEYWGPETAEGFFHAFSALLVFIVSTLMLLLFHKVLSWLGKRWQQREASSV